MPSIEYEALSVGAQASWQYMQYLLIPERMKTSLVPEISLNDVG